MKNYENLIIEYCKENRVSTTEVADALGKQGVLPLAKPLNVGHYKVGRVFPVFTAYGSNYEVHDQILAVSKNDIVMIFTHKCDGLAIFGELVSKFLLFYQKASAVVVHGLVRDLAKLKRENYAIWSEGNTPLGCKNNQMSRGYPGKKRKEILNNYAGSIAICDDGGVTIIKKEYVNQDTLERLKRIELQEDIWSFCLDTLKWDTKKIICEKAYLEEQEFLVKSHIAQFDELNKGFDRSDE
jgi:4-hydroxy-4-methyl-2-oxoglutarate aldolase